LYEKEIEDPRGVNQGLTRTAMKVRDVEKVLYEDSEQRKTDRLVTAIQSEWRIAEREEWMAESEGDLAEELHSVEQVKRICAVPCLRTVSVL
jgi:hypothetical protein